MAGKESKFNETVLIIGGVVIFLAIVFLPFILFKKSPEFERKILESIPQDWRDARYYDVLENGIVQCNLCPNNCLLKEGERGLCKVRENRNGELYTLNYSKAVSVHIDPVEKKPIFHMLPGTGVYSVATAGCNFSCLNCQNWQISQAYPEDLDHRYLMPEEIVAEALRANSRSIAYTYSEPTIFYEYMYDTAVLAHQAGLKNIMVTNGYISQEPLQDLLPYMDAFNVDLKGFSEEFYMKVTGGKLAPVLETLKTITQAGKLLEITYLIIPTINDSEAEIREAVKWIRNNIGVEAIIHFSRFHPDYKLTNLPPTPIETIKKARQIALDEGLKYVYIGNVSWPEAEATYCDDGNIAIARQGFIVTKNNLTNGQCEDGTKIPGIWE